MRKMIHDKLQELLNMTDDIPLDCDLLSIGLDSFIGMRLIVELEIMFDLSIDDDDLLIENFGTILMIEQMLIKSLNED